MCQILGKLGDDGYTNPFGERKIEAYQRLPSVS